MLRLDTGNRRRVGYLPYGMDPSLDPSYCRYQKKAKTEKPTGDVTGCPYGVYYLGSSGVGAWGCVDNS